MNKKILYVEISTAHTEIINSFVEALVPSYEVLLLINEKSKARVQNLSSRIRVETLTEETYLVDILRVKKEFNPDLLLLNSAQGRRIRDLCARLIFDSTPMVGVHHNAENLYKSFTQRLIHFKIKRYIVLADFIRDFIKTKINAKRLQVESFYPLAYADKPGIEIDLDKRFFVIPGVLEQDRRDYLGLVKMVQRHHESLDPRVQFVLLGNAKNHDGPEIVDEVKNANLQSRFVFFDNYVEDEILLAYVRAAQAVMPLMHPGTRWFEKYFETKISGAYNLGFAFNKRLLMHHVFQGKAEFQHHGVFYGDENFTEVLNQASLFSKTSRPEKFQPGRQQRKLIEFLG